MSRDNLPKVTRLDLSLVLNTALRVFNLWTRVARAFVMGLHGLLKVRLRLYIQDHSASLASALQYFLIRPSTQ